MKKEKKIMYEDIQQIHLYQYFQCARREREKKRSTTYIRPHICKQNFNSFNVFVQF